MRHMPRTRTWSAAGTPRILCIVAACTALLALAASARAIDGRGTAERRCLLSVDEALADAVQVGGDTVARCIGAFAEIVDGDTGGLNGGTVERCLQFDGVKNERHNVSYARSSHLCRAARESSGTGVDPRPPFGLPPAPVASSAGHETTIGFARELFGFEGESAGALRTIQQSSSAQRCQRVVWNSVRGCAEARQRTFRGCFQSALAETSPLRRIENPDDLTVRCLRNDRQSDDHGWIADACGGAAGIGATVARRCAGEDLDALFPGCSGEASTTACLERKTACRACLALDAGLHTSANCDLFDDGAVNGTCNRCGDGVTWAPEECDDGNDDPLDGCTPSCTRTRGKCRCYSAEEIDAALPPGAFDEFGGATCTDDDFETTITAGSCDWYVYWNPHVPPEPTPFHRIVVGIMESICFFSPEPLSPIEGGFCSEPDFDTVDGEEYAGCRTEVRRSKAWQRECAQP